MPHLHSSSSSNERKTLIVIIFTILAMFAEIIYGYLTNSMALLADGYHMATHSIALFLTYIAYLLIRKFQNSKLFPNGTDKIGTLMAYTSSLFLGFTGLWIIIEAITRFFNPLQIQFNEAILIAFIGLIVNGVCIVIMKDKHNHCHDYKHIHKHHTHSKDYNFKAAYLHILADVLTSILAIIALIVGKYFSLIYLDSLIGILGGIVILKWATELLKNTIKELIDMKFS